MKKKIITILAVVAAVFSSVMFVPNVSAKRCVCPDGSENVGRVVDECNVANCGSGYVAEKPVTDVVVNIINVLIGIVGLITVIMIIVGGIMYATSSGDAGKAKRAKDAIMYGLIGLVIAILAFAIVQFVSGKV